MLQAFLHSLTATVISGRSLQAWDIENPLVRQKFRLMVLLVPVFSYPLYQIINPERGSVTYRLDALFDSGRWLNIELWGKVPLGVLFVVIFVLTTIIFLFQELIPILRHAAESRQSEIDWDIAKVDSRALKAIEGLPVETPEVYIKDDEELFIYSATGKSPAVFLSTGLINGLGPKELQAAIVHEIAHIRRSRRPLIIFTYLVRALMFFSPATLVEFRRVVEEEEKICDDSASAITGAPIALAGALQKLRHEIPEDDGMKKKNPVEIMREIEIYSHDMLIQSRIQRLLDDAEQNRGRGWPAFIITFTAVLVINYFIV